jgi:hypothetical protein
VALALVLVVALVTVPVLALVLVPVLVLVLVLVPDNLAPNSLRELPSIRISTTFWQASSTSCLILILLRILAYAI